MSNNVLWHGDGCDTQMAGGMCPRCRFPPSMQDTFLAPPDWKPKVAEGHQAATSYQPGDIVVITCGESRWAGARVTVLCRKSTDPEHQVRCQRGAHEMYLHQNEVKLVNIVERIGALDPANNPNYPHACKGCGHPMGSPGYCWVCQNPE